MRGSLAPVAPQPLRLFFALFPAADVLQALLCRAQALREQWQPRGRWTRPERVHLTLVFLGDIVPHAGMDVPAQAIRAGDALRGAPFTLLLDQAFSFPGRRAPWVLGPSGGCEPLMALQRALLLALHAQGLHPRPEPAFVPHLTLLRDADCALAATAIEPVLWPVQSFVLVRSHLHTAPGYEILRRWTLS